MFRRVAIFVYGVLSYLTFFGTFLYAIGFNAYGDEYKRYQHSVPMIVPVRIGKARSV